MEGGELGVDARRKFVGYVDGCWDIMHSGHYNAIRQAKAICNQLVVGVHSDAEIEKNKALPVMQQEERYALLAHIKWIDQILYDVPYSPQLATLERAHADFCIHGDDMPVNADGVNAYDEMERAGRLRIIRRTEGVSTTDIIGRLLTLARSQHAPGHAWMGLQPSEDAGPVRVNADDALDHCAPAATYRTQAASTALISELAAKYSMSNADIDKLNAAFGASAFTTEANVRGLQESSSQTASAVTQNASLRTHAPVQLLASTRRIGEFSSALKPGSGDRIVYACGSFDMFHVGHAEFLKEARALGTFLLVGIYEDVTVRQAKGPIMPVMSLNERVLNVCACKWVDEVIIGAPRTVTEDLVKTWDIHVVARAIGHARSFGGPDVAAGIDEAYSVPRRLGTYVEIQSRWPELCHATIVERIIRKRELYERRNSNRARREDDYYASKSRTVHQRVENGP